MCDYSATVTNGQVFQHDPNKAGHGQKNYAKHLTRLKKGKRLIYKLCKWTVLGTLSSSCYVRFHSYFQKITISLRESKHTLGLLCWYFHTVLTVYCRPHENQHRNLYFSHTAPYANPKHGIKPQ